MQHSAERQPKEKHLFARYRETRGVGWLLFSLQASCSVMGIRGEETVPYEVIVAEDDKEIRKYQSHIVALTEVEGDYKSAGNKGFRILAGYIFGKNQKKQKIAMTAPVARSEPAQSENIAMTAPVALSKKEGSWEISFVMPSKYKMEDLPTPLDERVRFAQVPEKLKAALQYSWFAGEEKNQQKFEELKTWLASQKDYKLVGGPVYAGFDPPWTIPFLRKNEVQVELSQQKSENPP